MNKIITLAIAFLLFIPFASINGNNVSLPNGDGILYVGGSGPNNYTKIQSAINYAGDDIELYIWGGLYLLLNVNDTLPPIGFFVRVVNNGDDWISGNYSYHILNPDWYFNISFYVAPHQEYKFHQAFKDSFTFIVVKLTVENKTLIRSGFMIMGFTVFLTSIEIDHSEAAQDIWKCKI
ncbi:MAG: hypothetical protein FE040_00510 [Thermoplasmata archaeon]|nr:MAG: hypothetical protein FE040_00510 [Thermoplasmata archaeon]RLF62380.1 MAG: hypothetical protein DRN31_04160 [Thermoplasmata archaeon]